MTTPDITHKENSSTQLAKTYEFIKTPLHLIAGVKVINWKNESNSIGRRFVCGFALAGLAIAGVVDMVAAIAICMLSSPTELAGYEFSRSGWERLKNGGLASFTFLTIYQYENIKGNASL